MNIAEKYQVEFLRPQIVARIEADWPDTLGKWDATRASESESEYWPRKFEFEPVAALNFATRFGIRKILPAVMYTLACTPYSSERSAESVPVSEAPDTSTGAGGVPETLGGQEIENGIPIWCRARRSARWAMLSAAHHIELGRLRESLNEEMLGACRYIFSNDHRPAYKRCTSRNADVVALERLEHDVERMHLAEAAHADVLGVLLSALREEVLEEIQVCEFCAERISIRRNRKRKELWEFLVKRCMS